MTDLVGLVYAMKEAPNVLLKMSEQLKFVGYCLSNANETQSQCYQDIFVLYETGYKKNGYFVDFGATNGKSINNSFLLEKDYGWTGIVAEPNPFYHEELKKNRDCHISEKCVYSRSNETIDFINCEIPDLSSIREYGFLDEHSRARESGNITRIETVSLLDLLEEYNAPQVIDYLSIDTEGSEYIILESFFANSKEYQFRTITVEHNYVPDARNNINQLLTKNGYTRKFTEFSRWDDFYVKDIR